MKTLATIRMALLFVAAVVFPLLTVVSGVAAQEVLLFSDDATGGDCALVGTWDPAAKTCVLTTDLVEPVEILSDGITLDGRGHFMTGTYGGPAITINGRVGVEVRDLVIEGFSYGVVMNYTWLTLVDGVTVRGTVWGIWMNNQSRQNMLIGNTLEDNEVGVQVSWYAAENVIEGNVFDGNLIGINLGYTHHDEILNNAFVGNGTQLATRGFYNIVEANYWSDFDTPAEGCADADADGFCDAPYLLTTGMDPLPATGVDVDTQPPVVFVAAAPSVLTPDDRKVDVLVTGYADDSKSGVASVLITLEDEYGVYDQVIADFGTVVTLKAKCDPKDADGRTYLITATAVDGKGNEATATATVLVPNAFPLKTLQK